MAELHLNFKRAGGTVTLKDMNTMAVVQTYKRSSHSCQLLDAGKGKTAASRLASTPSFR